MMLNSIDRIQFQFSKTVPLPCSTARVASFAVLQGSSMTCFRRATSVPNLALIKNTFLEYILKGPWTAYCF